MVCAVEAGRVSMTIEAVTFDFWNTLVREEGDKKDRRATTWLALLAERGHPVEPEALDAAISAGWYEYVRHWTENVPFGARDVVEVMLDRLEIGPDRKLTDAMVAVITDPPLEHRPPLNPGVLDVLGALHGAGVRIGIVCDVGLTPSPVLRKYLELDGALGFFDHWSFSDEVGVYKPDAKIFRHALEGLGGVAPEHAAHIGDLRRTDIFGAQSMGMTAVRYTGVHDDPAMPDAPVIEADHVIAAHAELPEVLGIA